MSGVLTEDQDIELPTGVGPVHRLNDFAMLEQSALSIHLAVLRAQKRRTIEKKDITS